MRFIQNIMFHVNLDLYFPQCLLEVNFPYCFTWFCHIFAVIVLVNFSGYCICRQTGSVNAEGCKSKHFLIRNTWMQWFFWRNIKEYWKVPKRTRSCSSNHFRTYKLSSRSGIYDFCRCKCMWDLKVLPVTEWMRQLNWRWAAAPGREGCVNGTNGLGIQHIDTSHTTWSAATVKVSLKAWIIFLDTKSITWVWLTVWL